MTMDRSVKSLLALIVVALALIALNPWLERLRLPSVEAQGTAPQYEISVPKAWGKVIAYGSGNLLLEAADGTLREVDIRGKAPEYPRIKVLVRWN